MLAKLTALGATLCGVSAVALVQVAGAAAAQAVPPRPEGVWPTSWLGYLGPIAALVGLGSVLYARTVRADIRASETKVENMVNGLGARVERVERATEHQDALNDRVIDFMGRSETHRTNIDRRLDEIGRDVAFIRDRMTRGAP